MIYSILLTTVAKATSLGGDGRDREPFTDVRRGTCEGENFFDVPCGAREETHTDGEIFSSLLLMRVCSMYYL